MLLGSVRREHSRKPIEVYEVLKEIFNIPLISGLELFGTVRESSNTFLDIFGDQFEGNFDEVISPEYSPE